MADEIKPGDGCTVTVEGIFSQTLAEHEDQTTVDQPLTAVFTYLSGDPYAVTMTLLQAGETDNPWAFARDILAGHERGWGDVAAHWAGGEVRLTLWSPCCQWHSYPVRADVAFPGAPVMQFLRESFEIVPRGCESRHVDLDAALTQLLGA